MATNSLRDARLGWYIPSIIGERTMAGSQGRDNWAAMHRGFGWRVPADFNIAQACCGRWAGRADAHERVAIIAHGQEPAGTLTFAQLQREANAMSNLLAGL